MHSRWLKVCLLLTGLAVLGALHVYRRALGTDGGDRSAGAAPGIRPIGPTGYVYPPARWRLVTLQELSRTSLHVSQIVIRHQLSAEFPFRPGAWEPDGGPPDRSVEDALRLAERIAEQASESPATFAELARKFSEDVVSRPRGGSLGVMRGDQLVPLGILDALATLAPGEVSKAFRTPFGFHIVKRDPLPAAMQVAGQRLAVAYQGTFSQARPVTRSRAEARSIIDELVKKVAAKPEAFSALVRKYSDTLDREQDGDLGELSTQDPEYLPAEVEALAALPLGGVSEILDTRFGFTLLRRTPPVPRQVYAMEAIELSVDRSSDAGPARLEARRELASRILGQLAQDPTLFARLQATHCCKGVQRWTAGRRAKGVEQALDALELGQLREQPLEQPEHLLILRRLDPATLPPEPARRAELPSPEEPDFESFLPFNDGANLAEGCRVLIAALGKEPSFTSANRLRAGQVLLDLSTFMASHSNDAPAIRRKIQDTLDVLKKELGEADYRRFVAFAKKWAIEQMLPSRETGNGP
jgi:hypothetical protein